MKKLNISIAVLSLLAASCGVEVTPAPLDVSGRIDHVVSIDAASLSDFFFEFCSKQYSVAEEIRQCASSGLADFFNNFGELKPTTN